MKKIKKAQIIWRQDSTLGLNGKCKLNLQDLQNFWINYMTEPIKIYLLEKEDPIPKSKLGWFYGKGFEE
jgi:hypothetical protein